MGTTPLGIRYPELTAAANIPADMQNLANDVNGLLTNILGTTVCTFADATIPNAAGSLRTPTIDTTRSTAGLFTIVSTTRVRANFTGLILVTGGTQWAPNSNGVRNTDIRLNAAGNPVGGTRVTADYQGGSPSTASTTSPPLEPWQITVNQYLEYFVFHTAGAGGLAASAQRMTLLRIK
jgi:hypothetical protein